MEQEPLKPFLSGLQHRQSEIQTFQKVINSPYHKIVESESFSDQNTKQLFCYHYAQSKQFMLGEGSYGKVYICFYNDQIKNCLYKLALKIIQIPNSIQEIKKIEQIVAFTRQQVKSLIRLRINPNIIKIQDVIAQVRKYRIYLVLQYCNDKDLASYFTKLHRTKQLTREEDILRYFKQILHAFQDLYELNIIHRDIKPENILVNNGILKIADFGLSRQLFQRTEEFYQEHYGTFVTASPQIRFKERYTNKCDIYSLGVTLYWMIYQTFPYKNQFSREQFLRLSIKFQSQSQVKISNQLIELIKNMLVYSQQGRIQWHQLFSHPIFDRFDEKKSEIDPRQTIGRNLNDQYSSQILDNSIPKEFYLYSLSGSSSFDMTILTSKNFNQNQLINTYIPFVREFCCQKFKINFLKQVLKEVQQLKITDRIKNKMQLSIMKNLIRFGIQKYIIYIMKKINNELQGISMCQIFDPRALNSAMKSDSQEFNNFVKGYYHQVENYEKSNKKPKLSEDEKDLLRKRCKEYQLYTSFQRYLDRPILNEQEFLEDLKRCFIEVIYFIKDEVKFYRSKKHNLAEIQQKRYRELIILIHHFFMVILVKSIFHGDYIKGYHYDSQKFLKAQKYDKPQAFEKLSQSIIVIVDKFEN